LKKSVIRIRVSEKHVHYGGGLVNGAFIADLFGDVATELLIMCDGDEGLLRREEIDFLAPVYAGEFIEAVGWITKMGKTSREMYMEAWKVIQPLKGAVSPLACEILKEPILIATAKIICVTPLESQRGSAFPKEELLP
jgi:3-aminobutyryl-CoA ammonia-lyase